MLKLLGIDESETNDRSSVLPGYMLRLVIAVAGLGVAFTLVIIVNAFTLDTDDRSDLSKIGTPVVMVAAGAVLLLLAGMCKDVEMPKSCCPKCSRWRTIGVIALLLIIVPVSNLLFSLAVAGLVLAWLVSIEGVATRLRVVAVVEIIMGLILTEILRRAGAWNDGYIGGILLAAYSFCTLFLPAMLILGTVGQRPTVARASCVGCAVAAFHAAAIVLSAVSTLFAAFISNRSTSVHDERCISLNLDTPLMWFESLVSTTNDKVESMPERYRSKGDIPLPCLPTNVSTTMAPSVTLKKVDDYDEASIGAALFFAVVAIYVFAVVITCSCFIKDTMLVVTPKEAEEQEGEGMEEGTSDAAQDEDSVDLEDLTPQQRRKRRLNQILKSMTLSPQMKERIKLFLKQLLGSTARLVCLGVFVLSAIGILVLWDVVVARPESRNSRPKHRDPAQTPASEGVQIPAVSGNLSLNGNSSIFNSSLGFNRRIQASDSEPVDNTTMATPVAPNAPGTETEGDVDSGVPVNKEECFLWCHDVEEDDMAKRCKIPGCTRCDTCQLDQCADWCLDIYPNLESRCISLACTNCPECERKPCGQVDITTAAPTPPARVARVPSETPVASLPEEYISVTWCSLGPWAAIALGTLAFSCHVLACSLAGEWASRYEGKSEDDAMEDPGSSEAAAVAMARPGFSPANMIKREPQPAPARIAENNVRVFNI